MIQDALNEQQLRMDHGVTRVLRCTSVTAGNMELGECKGTN